MINSKAWLTSSVMALCSLSLSSVALADEASQILAQLATKPLVRASFVQEKTLPSLQRPLVSSGQMLFDRQYGVLWRLSKPVQADLVVTKTKMLQKTARTQSEISLARSPYGSGATLLLQLMSGNEAAVKQAFKVQKVSYQPQQWSIELTPNSTDLKKLFSTIQAEGDQYIRQITLTENLGGKTIIRFTQPTDQPKQLDNAESKLFQMAK